MLKIKSIEFIKAVYDESISHNVFSIANVTFSNAQPIYGALLFWKKNDDHLPFTTEDEYKFFYDMANVQYPKGTTLSKDERQELAYILLEQRGSVGSYSFSTSYKGKSFFPAKAFATLPPYDEAAFQAWHDRAILEHHSKLTTVIEHLDFSLLCLKNRYLSEQFLIDPLKHNRYVLARLSKSFKTYMIAELKKRKKKLQFEIAEDVDYFIEADDFYSEYNEVFLPEAEEIDEEPLEHFEYVRGSNVWPGSDHLISGIPSLQSRQYDRYGDRRLTNEQMAAKFKHYTPEQLLLFSGICDLHWLAKFKHKWDWSYVCAFNPHLTEHFLRVHAKYIQYPALGQNTKIKLSEEYIADHMKKFNLQQPVPLIICHLTEQFYLANKEHIIVNRALLVKYSDAIDSYDYMLLEDLIDEKDE